MKITIEISDLSEQLLNKFNEFHRGLTESIEIHIKNTTPYMSPVEFGSGLYSDDVESKKQLIRPINAKALVIPVFGPVQIKKMFTIQGSRQSSLKSNQSKSNLFSAGKSSWNSSNTKNPSPQGKNRLSNYLKNKSAIIKTNDEARYNAERYPDIMSRIKAQYPTAIGFLFRKSAKGQKPRKVVRGSVSNFKDILTEKLRHFFNQDELKISEFKVALNRSSEEWLNVLINRTPYLTGKLKAGWKIVKKA